MRRLVVCLLVTLFTLPAFAVDPGHADGSMTADASTITLAYAYVMDRNHNDLTNKRDTVKIVLTDKPLPAGTKLSDVDYNFPDGILGVVVCVDRQFQPMHLVVQHPQGVYDGGWAESNADVRVHMKRTGNSYTGRLTAKKVEKPSVTFAFDAEFAADLQ